MKVTAVVLNWRRPDDTIACVRSIRETSPETEVIVVDNASGDGSAERLSGELPDMLLIANEANLGYAGGNNVGIRSALERGADGIFVVNNDTIVLPGCIEGLTALIEDWRRAGHAGVFAPLSLRADDPETIDFFKATVDLWNVALLTPWRGQRTMPEHETDTDYATGSALMIDRLVFDDVQPFDERFFLVWEDVDFCLRARRAAHGRRAVADPSARVLHRGGPSFGPDGHRSPLYQYFFVRNSFLIVSEHVPRWRRARTRRMLERRYRGWIAKAERGSALERALTLGLEHGLARRWGPPPDEIASVSAAS